MLLRINIIRLLSLRTKQKKKERIYINIYSLLYIRIHKGLKTYTHKEKNAETIIWDISLKLTDRSLEWRMERHIIEIINIQLEKTSKLM